MHACGAIPSVHDYHLGAFLREYFADGTDFKAMAATEALATLQFDDLPLAEAQAFSIDDSTTTEIDDAFSMKPLADGRMRVGIHISAPALGIAVDSPLDVETMQRLSCLLYTSRCV